MSRSCVQVRGERVNMSLSITTRTTHIAGWKWRQNASSGTGGVPYYLAGIARDRSSVQLNTTGKYCHGDRLLLRPWFMSELSPQACLAAIICAAMKGMLKRALDLKVLWRVSKLDFACWIVAAVGTIFLDAVRYTITWGCFDISRLAVLLLVVLN